MWVFTDREKFASYYPEKIADEDGKPIITPDKIPTDNAELYLFKLLIFVQLNFCKIKFNMSNINDFIKLIFVLK